LGRGGYDLVDSMEEVGDGRGEWVKEVRPQPSFWPLQVWWPQFNGKSPQYRCGGSVLSFALAACMLCCAGLLALVAMRRTPEAHSGPGINSKVAIVRDPKSAFVTYDCDTHSDRSDSWSEERRDWCCERGHGSSRDCPLRGSSTTWSIHDCVAGYANWRRIWSLGKQEFCCTHFERGCATHPSSATSTTTTEALLATTAGCKARCTFAGQGASCGDLILKLAKGRFPGDLDSCSLAQQLVLQQCPVCSACDPGCNAQPPYDCDAGMERQWSTSKTEWCCLHKGIACSPLTPVPLMSGAQGCMGTCTRGGRSASCSERIQSVADEHAGRADACIGAISTVMRQCPICSLCPLAASGCVALPAAGTKSALAASSRDGGIPLLHGEQEAMWKAPRSSMKDTPATVSTGATVAIAATVSLAPSPREEVESTAGVRGLSTTTMPSSSESMSTRASTSTGSSCAECATDTFDGRLCTPERRSRCCEVHSVGCPTEAPRHGSQH